MIVTEIFVVEDCLLYRTSVSSSDTFNITLPSKFSISALFTKNYNSQYDNFAYFRIYNGNTLAFDIGMLRGKGSLSIRGMNPETMVADNNSAIMPYNQAKLLEYTYDNGVQTLTGNGVTITGTDNRAITHFQDVLITRYIVADLKIKPL